MFTNLRSKPLVLGLLGGVAGIVVGVLLLHLYMDHYALHQLITLANQAATKK